MTHIYFRLVAAGCLIDHHESDLYVKDSPEAREVLRTADIRDIKSFLGNHDRELWFELPFMYVPFWRKAGAASHFVTRATGQPLTKAMRAADEAERGDYRTFRVLMGRAGYQGHLGGGYDGDEHLDIGAAARSFRRYLMATWCLPQEYDISI